METFGYDYLDRLTSARTYLSGSASPSRTLDFGYDRRGHLTRKTSDVPSDADVTAYRYENGRAGRRRLTEATVGGVRQMFGYDASGHVVRYAAAGDDDRFIAWDARGLPTRVTAGSSARDASPTARDEFRYGPDGNRYYRKSAWRDADGALRTERAHYVGAYEEVARAGDAKYRSVEKTRIGDVVLHVRTTTTAGRSSSFEHLHRDHLGSVESATDAAGAELLALGYDPFGERRDRGWTAQLGADDVEALADARDMRATRGYAGHEHLDRTGFVHMNGRLYDPRLGRYLSPDPIVADATDSRNWNLYAYVGNAPTSYVDPTGLFRAGPGCNVGGVVCLDGGGGGGFSTATARLARLRVRTATARIRVYGPIHVPSSRSDMGGRGGFFAPYVRQHIFRVPVFHATAHEVRMPDEGGEPADQPMGTGSGPLPLEPNYFDYEPGLDEGWSGMLTDPAILIGGAGALRGVAAKAPAASRSVWNWIRGIFSSKSVDEVIRARPKGIPKHWQTMPSRNRKGIKYVDPNNIHNSIRVMRGDPRSPYPHSRGPYVRWKTMVNRWIFQAIRFLRTLPMRIYPLSTSNFIQNCSND